MSWISDTKKTFKLEKKKRKEKKKKDGKINNFGIENRFIFFKNKK